MTRPRPASPVHRLHGCLHGTVLKTRACLIVAAALGAMLVTVALPAGAAPGVPEQTAPGSATYIQACGGTSWTAGLTNLCDGHLVYRDYVHDDYGADTGAGYTTSRTAALSPSAGDQDYGGEPDSTADLVRLELWLHGNRLHVEAEMNALFEADSTIVAVAIDTDDDPATGGGRWGPLDVSSDGWDRLIILDEGDPDTNLLSTRVRAPRGQRWRVQAAAAIASNGQVMNVAFRPNEEAKSGPGERGPNHLDPAVGTWFEDRQAAALGRGDISEFGHSVRRVDLRRRATMEATFGAGLHSRVYTSAFTIPPGEGASVAGVPGPKQSEPGLAAAGVEQRFQYLGRYQPYGVYIPDLPGPHGMHMVMHGSFMNYAGFPSSPAFQSTFGDQLNNIIVSPEGRGHNGYHGSFAERDRIDVFDDALATFDIDPDRVVVSGYSQGAMVAMRTAQRYPERFAGLISWYGNTGSVLDGTPLADSPADATGPNIDHPDEMLRNLRHIASQYLFSAADSTAHPGIALAMEQKLVEEGVPYRFYFHAGDHFAQGFIEQYDKEAIASADLVRVTNPPRVTLRRDPGSDFPELELIHDGAYWVHDVTEQDPAAYADVDLFSHACGGQLPTFTEGRDAGVTHLPWVGSYRVITGSQPFTAERLLTGSLANVTSVGIETAPSCLTGAFSYELTTDGPVTLHLDDGRTLRLDGAGAHTGSVS